MLIMQTKLAASGVIQHKAEGEERGRVRMLLRRGAAQADGAGGRWLQQPTRDLYAHPCALAV